MNKKNFAVVDNQLYVILDWVTAYRSRAASVLCANEDQLPMIGDDDNTPYVQIYDAVAWLERDSRHCTGVFKKHRLAQVKELKRIISAAGFLATFEHSDEYLESERSVFNEVYDVQKKLRSKLKKK